MFVDMLNESEAGKYNLESSLATAVMAGAPCPEHLAKRVTRELNISNLVVMIIESTAC